MPLHGPWADEQPRADLRVRQPVAGESRDQLLLRRELVTSRVLSLADRPAGGQQLAAGALGERLHADGVESVVRGAQLFARVDAPALAAQPLAVEQLRPGELGP